METRVTSRRNKWTSGGISPKAPSCCSKSAAPAAALPRAPERPAMSFAGMQVLSLESRRSTGIAELIRKQGGEPVLAPSMREAPLERNEVAFQFAERLFAGEFDIMILLTGVGTRLLHQALSTRYTPERFT